MRVMIKGPEPAEKVWEHTCLIKSKQHDMKNEASHLLHALPDVWKYEI